MWKLWCNLNYRYCKAQAYLTQDYAPLMSKQYETYADDWALELWRIERGLA